MSFAVTLLPVSSSTKPSLVRGSMLLRAIVRYGVYAAVFLYKAMCTGAFQNDVQRQEVTDLVFRFITVMKEAPSTETHICHGYSRMLRQLWHGTEAPHASSRNTRPSSNIDVSRCGQKDSGNTAKSTDLPEASSPVAPRADQDSSTWYWDFLGSTNSYPTSGISGDESDIAAFPTIEASPFGSFWPGITDFLGTGEIQSSAWERGPSADGRAGFETTN